MAQIVLSRKKARMHSPSSYRNLKVQLSLFFYLQPAYPCFCIIWSMLQSFLPIVLISGLLGFWQEYSASNAVAKLLAIVQIKAAVLRDGKEQEILIAHRCAIYHRSRSH